MNNSLQLAQLAADAKYNKEKQLEQWYSEYKKALGYFGWVVQGFECVTVCPRCLLAKAHSTRFEEYKSEEYTHTIDYIICLVAKPHFDAAELSKLQSLTDALKHPKNVKAVEAFKTSALRHNIADFQLGVVKYVANRSIQVPYTHGLLSLGTSGANRSSRSARTSTGRPKTKSSSFTRLTTKRSPSFHTASTGSLDIKGCVEIEHIPGFQTMRLNTDLYNKVRWAVEKKLEDAGKNFINSLVLP